MASADPHEEPNDESDDSLGMEEASVNPGATSGVPAIAKNNSTKLDRARVAASEEEADLGLGRGSITQAATMAVHATHEKEHAASLDRARTSNRSRDSASAAAPSETATGAQDADPRTSSGPRTPRQFSRTASSLQSPQSTDSQIGAPSAAPLISRSPRQFSRAASTLQSPPPDQPHAIAHELTNTQKQKLDQPYPVLPASSFHRVAGEKSLSSQALEGCTDTSTEEEPSPHSDEGQQVALAALTSDSLYTKTLVSQRSAGGAVRARGERRF